MRFEHRGYTFTARTEHDEYVGQPWKEYDCHGIVSEWTSRDKLPGERILHTDRRSRLYYDVQRTMIRARREGWGCGDPSHTHHTAREQAACAVERDYQRLRSWCRGEWAYVVLSVRLADPLYAHDNIVQHLGGVEDDDCAYLEVLARELADEIVARVEVNDPDIVLSEN